MRALDFSAPTRFTAEIRHRISLALEPFREALAAWLASELKAEVEISMADARPAHVGGREVAPSRPTRSRSPWRSRAAGS